MFGVRMAQIVLILCILHGTAAFTSRGTNPNEGVTTTAKVPADTVNIITNIILNTRGATTTLSFTAPPIPVQKVVDVTTVLPQRPFNLWDHISKYFSTLENQIVALNSEFCGRTCNFTHSLALDSKNGNCDDCSCRESCQLSGDCCPDLLFLRNQTQSSNYGGCVADSLPRNDDTTFYIMISRCPKSYTVMPIKIACEQPSYADWVGVIPHFDVDSGTSFRNIYCAQCHGYNDTRTWSTSITCSSFDNSLQRASSLSELFESTLESKTCYILWSLPFNAELLECRRKVKNVIESCNVTGLWYYYDRKLERACSLFSQVVFGRYRNIFCYMCNQLTNWYYVLTQRAFYAVRGPMTVSLTALIEFDNAEESRYTTYVKPTGFLSDSSSNESMITYLKQCRDVSVSCVEGKRLNGDQCDTVLSSSNMYGYRVCFQTNISLTAQIKPTSRLFTLVEEHFPGLNYTVLQLANGTQYVVDIQNCPHKQMYVVLRYIVYIYSVHVLKRDDFENQLMGDQMILTNSKDYIQYQAGCSSRPTLALRSGDVEHCSQEFDNFVFERMSPVAQYAVKILRQAQYIQLNKQLICPRIVLNSTQYIINYHNKIPDRGQSKTFVFPYLVFIKTQIVLKDGDFQELGNGLVVVCVSDYINATYQLPCIGQQRPPKTFLGVFSFICTSVSLFFLALTFLTYCLFPNIRTMGGVCNMGLVATLFSAQIVLEIGMEQNEDVIGCQTIGIFIHFLWLASVFWMNACTVLLFLKLSFPLKCRNFGHNLKKLFVFIAIYANGTSALIVGLNIAVNVASGGHIGYGGNICYMNTSFSKIYFFKIPIGTTILVNIGLFIFTMSKLRHHSSISSTRDSKINLFSCVKLSVITGLVWLSSYLYEVFHITVFAYIFTLLVGSQGVLFFIAIVANKNVMSLWSSCFVRSKRNLFGFNKNASMTSHSENHTGLTNISHSDSYELTRSKLRI